MAFLKGQDSDKSNGQSVLLWSVVMLLVIGQEVTGEQRAIGLQHYSSLNNLFCNNSALLSQPFEQSMSRIVCVKRCLETSDCVGVYHNDSGYCHGSKEKPSDESCTLSRGMFYYLQVNYDQNNK